MSQTVLDTVKARGYWRVNFRPATHRDRLPSASHCERVVEENSVSLRGWPYPPVLPGSDAVERMPSEDGFAEAVSYLNNIEFWKMFRSGQFIHYLALGEDWFREAGADKDLQDIEPLTRFSFQDAVYVACEIYEFLARLTRSRLYEERVDVSIQLHEMKGRIVWVHGPRRLPLLHEYRTGGDSINWSRQHEPQEVIENSRQYSAELLVHVFNAFGWDARYDHMAQEVERVFSGRFV